jgi:flagellar export protein FliJ
MKPFRFSLQAVLTVREQAEQSAQLRCLHAFASVEWAAGRLKSAEAALTTAESMRGAHLAGGGLALEFEHLRLYSDLLLDRRNLVAGELEEFRRLADQARQDLVGATQRREALERLRSRKRRLHNYKIARSEQQLLDELVGRGPKLIDAWREAAADL